MRIGVLSDTHGHLAQTQEAIRLLRPFSPEQLLHCGDIGSVEVVRLLEPWQTHFVLGNVDHNEGELEAAIAAAGQTFHGRFGSLELAGVRIALLHGDDIRRLQESIHSGQWDLVCHGHTHQARQQQIGKTLVLNPGAVYRARPHSVAVVELPQLLVHPLEF